MFLVVDGSALMYYGFYATCPAQVSSIDNEEDRQIYYNNLTRDNEGRFNGAIEIFLSSLLDIINNSDITEIAVCFDKSSESTFRKALYPAYKGTRTPRPEPLIEQMDNIKNILKNNGIKVLEHSKYEADDFAGTIVSAFSKDEKVVLLTKDKDYLQLINRNTEVWMINSFDKAEELCFEYNIDTNKYPPRVFPINATTCFNKYGVYPNQIVDWKAVSGDTSDNIPGIKGVADKTIIPLLHHYGSLNNIYEVLNDTNTDEEILALSNMWKDELGIKRPPIKVMKEKEFSARFCKVLATIKTDIPVKSKLEDFNLDKVDFYGLSIDCDDFGLETLKERFENKAEMVNERE